MRIKNYLHTNSFALSLALEQRLGTIPKWPTARHQPRSQGPFSSSLEKRGRRVSLFAESVLHERSTFPLYAPMLFVTGTNKD